MQSIYFLRLPKLQRKPPALQREHLALQDTKFLPFLEEITEEILHY
jgi:hypothetical protein